MIDNMDSKLVEDVKELCICCAKGIVLLSDRYKIHPEVIAKVFIEVFQKILDDMNRS